MASSQLDDSYCGLGAYLLLGVDLGPCHNKEDTQEEGLGIGRNLEGYKAMCWYGKEEEACYG